MIDPLSIGTNLVHELVSRVQQVRTNRAECDVLRNLAEQTERILNQLEGRQHEAPVIAALELVNSALNEARDVVDRCCRTNMIGEFLNHEGHALTLRHATGNLLHALYCIPMASLGIIADLQSDLVELRAQMRNSSIRRRGDMAQHASNVRDEIERASYQTGQGNARIKTLIEQLLQEHSLGIEEIKEEIKNLQKELVRPRQQGNELPNDDQKKYEFVLQTIIGVLFESLDDAKAQVAIAELANWVCCPISNQIMRDPVMMKDSNVIYDRSSITTLPNQGNPHDPASNVLLEPRDLVPIPPLRIICQTILKQYEAHSSTMNTSQGEDSQHSLEPGLYEGKGMLTIGSTSVYASQLLILEPNRGLVGCTMYKGSDYGDQANETEIGTGKWDDSVRELYFGDKLYNYRGIVECLDKYPQAKLKWNTKISAVDDPTKDYPSELFYSSPVKQPARLLGPAILQCEGLIDEITTQARYKSKLVLVLEVDEAISGWTYFESSAPKSKIIGRIMEGRWDKCGRLRFSIGFSNESTQLNEVPVPLKFTNAFNVAGIVSRYKRHGYPMFTSVVTKAEEEDILQSDNMPALLNGLKHLKYTSLHEVHNDWLFLLPSPSTLFQVSRSALGMNISFSYYMCI